MDVLCPCFCKKKAANADDEHAIETPTKNPVIDQQKLQQEEEQKQKAAAEKQKQEEEKRKAEAVAKAAEAEKEARRKAEEEERRKKEHAAALRLQSIWRIVQAKRRAATVRLERAKRHAAATVIQKYIRRFLAVRLRRRLVQHHRNVVIVRLLQAHDLNDADVTSSSDPYVLVHVEAGLSKENPNYAEPTVTNPEATLSINKSTIIYDDLNPSFNEDLVAVNVTGADTIVLTLMDKDTFTADDFLGQVVVDLSQHPDLFAGKTVFFSDVPVKDFLVPIRELDGTKRVISNIEIPGKGTISFSLRLAKRGMSQSGFLMKKANKMISFGAAQFHPRLAVLAEGELGYYENEHTIDTTKKRIKCKDILSFSYGKEADGTDFVLHIHTADEDFYFKWMPTETVHTMEEWLRKLQLNCPHIALNGEEDMTLLQRIEASQSGYGQGTQSEKIRRSSISVKNSGKLANMLGMNKLG